MNQNDLVRRVADASGVRAADVRRVLAALGVVVAEALATEDDVSLGPLGRVQARWRNGRTFRSIADFRKVVVDGGYAVRYRPGRALRDAVAGRTPQHWRDPRHQAAWRVTETLLGDLALYHRERAPHGLPDDDAAAEAVCRASFGNAWTQARAAYEARVPAEIREQVDHLLRGARSRWGNAAPAVSAT